MSEDATRQDGEMRPPRHGLYPIRAVSRLTGVSAVTLRAWERRYGLIVPSRTAKGHRLYSEADVARIRQVLALLNQGVGVGQAGPLLAGTADVRLVADPRAPAPVLGQASDPWPDYVERMLEGARRFDVVALDIIYNDALSLYPIDLVASRLTTPVLELLGAEWPDQEACIAREHFFSNFLRNKLGARFHYLNGFSQGPRLVAACPSGEHHELGLIQFALAAATQGYRLVMLGADVPAVEIAAAARIGDCRAVVLSVSARMEEDALAVQLATLVGLTPLPVLVGGAGAVKCLHAIFAAGAITLDTDFNQAIQRLGQCLGQPQGAASPDSFTLGQLVTVQK